MLTKTDQSPTGRAGGPYRGRLPDQNGILGSDSVGEALVAEGESVGF